MKLKLKLKNDLGKLMIMIGILTAIPIFVLPFYWHEINYALSFLIPSAISVVLGLLVCIIHKSKQSEESFYYSVKRGNLTVLFAWLWGILFGSLPFLFAGNLNFVQAIFESTSGWTTTGLSVMDVEITPQIFLFHRSFMQFCGGMGFVLMMVMIVQNKNARNLYNTEGHSDQLTASVLKTARTIFMLYFALFVAGTILYVICGMPVFDSIIHSMSALSTGGFSNKTNSIGFYSSIAIEAVTVLLMILGTTNFAVLLLLFKRKFKQAAKTSEVRFLFVLLLVVVPIVAFSLFFGLSMSLGDSFRHSVFNVVSALSTTGFSTVPFSDWQPIAIGVMVLLMLIGGGIGSTAGGLKLSRVYLMFRGAGINIRKRMSPNKQIQAPYYYRAQGKTAIDDNLLKDTYSFAFLYILIFFIGSLLICVTSGSGLAESMFEFSSSLGTVGLSIGITGPATGAGTLIVETIGMIFGRLEVFIIIIGFLSLFNKAK